MMGEVMTQIVTLELDRRVAGVMQRNERGEWVPAIPMPLQGVWTVECSCKRRFRGRDRTRRYREHYAYVHVLGYER